MEAEIVGTVTVTVTTLLIIKRHTKPLGTSFMLHHFEEGGFVHTMLEKSQRACGCFILCWTEKSVC
jgi:hypothetical protein